MDEPLSDEPAIIGMSRRTREKSDEELLAFLRDCWEKQRDLKFPPGLAGGEVNGHPLVLLDAAMAGCIQTFLKQGSLDLWRTSMLGLYYHDITPIVRMLNKEGARYFGYWEIMAELTLTLVLRQAGRIENP